MHIGNPYLLKVSEIIQNQVNTIKQGRHQLEEVSVELNKLGTILVTTTQLPQDKLRTGSEAKYLYQERI